MRVACSLSDATFKPQVDHAIARDGVDVVLRASEDELILLHHERSAFQICRFRGVAGRPVPSAVEFRGTRYDAHAAVIEEHPEPGDPDAIARFYPRLVG